MTAVLFYSLARLNGTLFKLAFYWWILCTVFGDAIQVGFFLQSALQNFSTLISRISFINVSSPGKRALKAYLRYFIPRNSYVIIYT